MKIVVDLADDRIPDRIPCYIVSGKWVDYKIENDMLLITSDSRTSVPPEAAAIPMSKVLIIREFNEEG